MESTASFIWRVGGSDGSVSRPGLLSGGGSTLVPQAGNLRLPLFQGFYNEGDEDGKGISAEESDDQMFLYLLRPLNTAWFEVDGLLIC